ncbi:hypothetical protein C3432_19885 [Citrobacter amalonaticus]|uniref:Uncharacterized protein n=1 Tax=Citrobacter amalonaticus TaxID=35703 RepID=A0A2S4RQ88_CITAM|nr:hypothetical protein C3432_19885 [Citrobacter amalonaticus]POT69054.1 hypothetical protein C3436_27020 [Citrobacter amalonaticus]POU59281.1 hypothetical protein C3430_26670 [Citrobacter amalonaticus]POV03400.1 hypothetical protein C3424_19205 [Citrobacter amalonaticus]
MRNAREFFFFDSATDFPSIIDPLPQEGSGKRSLKLWITLCVKRYKAGFCWGMQQSVIFLQFFYCGCSGTPYNAPPSTRRM